MERQADMASLQGTVMAAAASFPCLTQFTIFHIHTMHLDVIKVLFIQQLMH
jgi:hypothetical protein